MLPLCQFTSQQGTLGNYLAPEEKNTTQTFTAHVTSGACCARAGDRLRVCPKEDAAPKASLSSAFRGHPRLSGPAASPAPRESLTKRSCQLLFPAMSTTSTLHPPPRNVPGMPNRFPAPPAPCVLGLLAPSPGRGLTTATENSHPAQTEVEGD